LVDAHGVLLPRKGVHESLPLLLTTAGPRGKEGQPWGDAGVEAAARTASFLRPELKALRLEVFETSRGGLVLCTAAGTRVLWGHAPGAEPAGEASAAEKRERLVKYCRKHGSLDRPQGPYEHDMRPPGATRRRSLPRGD
jgi:hypothetical protein